MQSPLAGEAGVRIECGAAACGTQNLARSGVAGARLGLMPVFQRLLARWGFIKLDRYGLTRTSDDRILSMRPAVLDDGAGGRVVGWREDDLAMAELPPWESSTPGASRSYTRPPLPGVAPMPPVGSATSAAMPPAAAVPADRPVIPAPLPVPLPLAGESSSAGSAARAAVDVAAAAPVDEDDWEWTIALARARAMEPDVSAPAVPPPAAAVVATASPATASSATASPVTDPPVSARRALSPALTRTRPMATIAAKDAAAASDAATTRPMAVFDDIYSRPTRPAIVTPPDPEATQHDAPATVIPVPRLPSIHTTKTTSRLQPVLHKPAAGGPGSTPSAATAPTPIASTGTTGTTGTKGSTVPPASQYRFAKGTGPVPPNADAPEPSLFDDTDPNVSVGDRTTPGFALPPAARMVSLVGKRTSPR
jgi:hypothetical protein